LLWKSKHPTNSTREAGNIWEEVAESFLVEQHNLLPLTRNFHCRAGEIDLIMNDDGVICFIEVKYRKSNQFGGAISAVTSKKQQKLTKTAQFFLQQRGLNEYNTNCRFDVVAIEGGSHHPQITWLKNAF